MVRNDIGPVLREEVVAAVVVVVVVVVTIYLHKRRLC